MLCVSARPTIRGMSLAKLASRLRRLPADALYSHRTAAWLHGLDMPACDPIQVTLPQSSTTSHLAGMWLTRSDFAETEACEVRSLPATSRVRTIADLGRGLPLVEGVVALDMALREQMVSLQQLREWRRTHPRHRGLGRLTQAMELADAGSESQMETRLRLLLVLSGLPRPRVQVSLRDAQARPDLYYPEHRLAVEYDGVTHRSSLAADNRRQNRMIEAGYKILRFTAGDVLHRPASVVGQVERALRYSMGSPN